MRKFISILVSLSLIFTIIPTTNILADDIITKRKQLNGRDYTDSPQLAKKLDSIFKGNVGLSSGGRKVKVPVGCSKLTEPRMFTTVDKTSGNVFAGWQCYVYANAVYNTLFNECVGHGDTLSHSKKVITNGGSSLSYKKLKKAGVRCGAYMRVASGYSNGYMDNNGHSIIILSYNKSGISYLEGNSDNHGLVCVVESTWNEFNYRILSRISRKVCYIIQPTNKYYNSLYYAPKKVSLSRITSCNNNQVKLNWKKVSNANGYQIKYSTSKKFKKNTNTKKAASSAKSKTITKLESGKTYYFKVRAYDKCGKSKVYGKWSTVRKTKITQKDSNITTEPVTQIETTTPITETVTTASPIILPEECTTLPENESESDETTQALDILSTP